MEVIVLLKLEVDSEALKKGDDTDENIKAKIRAYIADVVGNFISRHEEYVTLLSSSLAVEINPTGTVQIQPSNIVLKIPPDTKIDGTEEAV